MASFYGIFFNRSSDLCAFPAFPRDQGYVVEVAIDETITKPFISLQAAILHSTCNGTPTLKKCRLTLSRGKTNSCSDNGNSYYNQRSGCLCVRGSNRNRNIPFLKSCRESFEFGVGKRTRYHH